MSKIRKIVAPVRYYLIVSARIASKCGVNRTAHACVRIKHGSAEFRLKSEISARANVYVRLFIAGQGVSWIAEHASVNRTTHERLLVYGKWFPLCYLNTFYDIILSLSFFVIYFLLYIFFRVMKLFYFIFYYDLFLTLAFLNAFLCISLIFREKDKKFRVAGTPRTSWKSISLLENTIKQKNYF